MIDSGRRIGSDSSQLRCTNEPGVARARALRRLELQDELLAFEALVREHLGVFDEDRAAMGHADGWS